MTPRRELLTSIALSLVGSALTIFSVRHAWVSYANDDLTIHSVRTSVRGSTVAGPAQALSLVGLAGVAAVAATRRNGRVVVGVVVALAGLLVVLDVALLLDDLPRRLAGFSGRRGLQIVSQEQYDAARKRHLLWPLLTMVGGLVTAAGGAFVAWRGRRWAALSSSYQVPAARSVETEPTDKATWDLFDRGDDPTT